MFTELSNLGKPKWQHMNHMYTTLQRSLSSAGLGRSSKSSSVDREQSSELTTERDNSLLTALPLYQQTFNALMG